MQYGISCLSAKVLKFSHIVDPQGLTAIESVELDANELTSIPATLFNDLKVVRWIDLRDNKISELPAKVFEGLTTLTELDLHNNNLSKLPDGIFSGLTSLRKIDLEVRWLHMLELKLGHAPLSLAVL